MLSTDDLSTIARARLDDADALVNAGRHDGAVYVCGYAVELGLKARICKTLHWTEYRTHERYEFLKTHDLDFLLSLSGVEQEVKEGYFDDWSVVGNWRPQARYEPIGSASEDDARSMIESAKAVLGAL